MEAQAQMVAGLFQALSELFGNMVNAFSGAHHVRSAPAPRTVSQARAMAEAATAIANAHRAVADAINQSIQAIGGAGLSPVATAPVIGAVMDAIVYVHASVYATVGAQVMAQMAGAEAARGPVGSGPSLTNLREITVPRAVAQRAKPMMNNRDAFAVCPHTGKYVSECPCGRH